jgi:hypothetical protein
MTRYDITITKVDEWGEPVPSAQAVVRVRAEGGRTIMEEITVRAQAGAELVPDQELLTDVGAIVQAFSQGSDAGRATLVRPAETRLDRPPAIRPASGFGQVTREGEQVTVIPAERVYRRMPEVDVLRDVYRQARTITGVAEHFGVPRHTAQGWITRLRRRGVDIGGTMLSQPPGTAADDVSADD